MGKAGKTFSINKLWGESELYFKMKMAQSENKLKIQELTLLRASEISSLDMYLFHFLHFAFDVVEGSKSLSTVFLFTSTVCKEHRVVYYCTL